MAKLSERLKKNTSPIPGLRFAPVGQSVLVVDRSLLVEIPQDCWSRDVTAKNWLAIVRSGDQSPDGYDVDRSFVNRREVYYDLKQMFRSGLEVIPVEFGANWTEPTGDRGRIRKYGTFTLLPDGNVEFTRYRSPEIAVSMATVAEIQSANASTRPSRDIVLVATERALRAAYPERWAIYMRAIEQGWTAKEQVPLDDPQNRVRNAFPRGNIGDMPHGDPPYLGEQDGNDDGIPF